MGMGDRVIVREWTKKERERPNNGEGEREGQSNGKRESERDL